MLSAEANRYSPSLERIDDVAQQTHGRQVQVQVKSNAPPDCIAAADDVNERYQSDASAFDRKRMDCNDQSDE